MQDARLVRYSKLDPCDPRKADEEKSYEHTNCYITAFDKM